MQKKYLMVWVFRLVLLATVVAVVTSTVKTPISNWLAKYAQLVGWNFLGLLGLWLFGNLCQDIRELRDHFRFTAFEPNRVQADPTGLDLPTKAKKDSLESRCLGDLELTLNQPITPPKGDRVFKTSNLKTCLSCRWFDCSGRLCQIDQMDLAEISISVVSCQHWEEQQSQETDERA